jgi:hypothetical protein
MSDAAEVYADLKAINKQLRAMYGVPCPVCVEKLPRAHPTILEPQHRCRIHGYRDPRPHITDEQWQAAAAACGSTVSG